MSDSPYDQRPFRIRLEWGPVAVHEVARHSTYAVIVDVLSFTTTLTVAMDHGTRVLPFRWKDGRAAAHAAEHGAVLARGRLETRDLPGMAGVSLSPAALREAPGIEALVLPSPNGSAITVALADAGTVVVAAALRNRLAVARWLAARLAEDPGATVTVVAGGERWGDDGSLRPCLEDQVGAGAVVASLAELGVAGTRLTSPEARAAAAVFRDARADLPARLADCAGGRELAGHGFAADVAVAAELDTSPHVPLLVDGAFVRA